MHQLKRVGVLSVAKVMGMIYGVLGFIIIPFVLLGAVVGALAGQQRAPLGFAMALIIALMMPIMYGLIGFLAGALMAFLYNLFAGRVGGIELELQPPAAAAATALPVGQAGT